MSKEAEMALFMEKVAARCTNSLQQSQLISLAGCEWKEAQQQTEA